MNAWQRHGELRLADGRTIAWQASGDPQAPLIVALHGWLDNSESFRPLAAHLHGYQLVAFDLPGHGHSSHKSSPYVFIDWIDDLHRITVAAGWSRFILLGHSLGALVASAYAGVFPERVERLILLEGLGPLSQPDSTVPAQIRRVLERRLNTARRQHPGFASAAQAVAARRQVGDLDEASATLIVERNLKEQDGRFGWRSDPALREQSPLRMSEGQALALLHAITAPVLFIRGSHGFHELGEAADVRRAAISQLRCEKIAGGHHFHMESPADTALCIEKFCALR